ncbi:MAG: HU family DNA-binding protein [Phycisphaerales bacterium]
MAKRTARKTKKKAAKKKTVRRTATRKKTTRKAPARRKTSTRKKVAKKATARTAPAKITGAKGKPRSKSEVCSMIADHVGITKKEVAQVFDVMGDLIQADLKKGSVGTFNVPGMMKVLVQRKPATKARKGINPFTGEETIFKAKPARNVVKVRPLKGLKDRVA